MAQFDFRQALSSSADRVDPSTPQTGMDPATLPEADSRGKSVWQSEERLLTQADRMSLLFALLVFSGGLFCAFYFFNGTELLQTAKTLPRELLYPRSSAVTQIAKADMLHRGNGMESRFADGSAASSDRRTKAAVPSAGSPPAGPSSNPATAGASSSSPPSLAFSPPSNHSAGGNVHPSGAGTASRTVTQAVTNLALAKASDVKRTAMQLPKRVHAPLKTAKRQLANTKATAARITQNVQRASRPTAATQNNLARSTANAAAGGLGRQGFSGLDRGGGAGGLGGRLPAGAAMSLHGGGH